MSDDILELTLLFDFYGELLTKKQRAMFESHYLNDFSLGEIGDDMGISRQAVFDTLKRVKKSLRDFEKKLGLVSAHGVIAKNLDDILSALSETPVRTSEIARKIAELKELL